jgi:hypothetical protein
MKVLIACEFSGRVREAFRAKGHDAWSCDLLPSDDNSPFHIQGDVLGVLSKWECDSYGWDLMIAHPPCTYLCVTGNKWMKPEFKDRFPNRAKQREDAVDFFMALADASIPKICIENPVGIMSTRWRKPDQYIQPWQFGEKHSKKTGLWLKGLPKLKHTKLVKPEFYIYKDGRKDPMWHVKTMHLNKEDRMKARSLTFQGIADAMADQWG